MDRVFSQCIMGVSALLTKCEQDDTSQVPRRQSIVSILMPLLLESLANKCMPLRRNSFEEHCWQSFVSGACIR